MVNVNKRFAARTVTLLAALSLGVGGAFAVYAAVQPNATKTTTVVRQVTVSNAQQTSNASSLSVADIYRRAHQSVVEITVTEGGAAGNPFPSQTQQAQGSGFVYDSQGNIVTDQHVVAGATQISVKFWNGATYKATSDRHRRLDRPRGHQGRRRTRLHPDAGHARRLEAARRR